MPGQPVNKAVWVRSVGLVLKRLVTDSILSAMRSLDGKLYRIPIKIS